VETGFDPSGAYTTYLNLSMEGYDEETGRRFQEALLTGLRARGWVAGASLSSDLPLDLARSSTVVLPDGWQASADRPGLGVDFNRVSDGYFETLAIALRAGRGFRTSDRPGQPPVVVVSQAFADAAWPGQSALGRLVRLGLREDAEAYQVVGVAEDVKNQLITEVPAPFLYLPLAQAYSPTLQLVVRTSGARSTALTEIRGAVLEADPSLSLGPVVSLERYTSVGLLPQRIAAGLTTALALVALLLSGLGVYGVISYAVGRSRREIGIRLALGASQGSVAGRFLRSGAMLALPGLVVGAGLATGIGRLLGSLLLEVRPYDPIALGSVAVALLGVVLLATWIPARRAARVDPARSLRAD